jgi:hypothetical protein
MSQPATSSGIAFGFDTDGRGGLEWKRIADSNGPRHGRAAMCTPRGPGALLVARCRTCSAEPRGFGAASTKCPHSSAMR